MWVKLAHEKGAQGQIQAPDNPFALCSRLPSCMLCNTHIHKGISFLLLFCPHPFSCVPLPTSENFVRCCHNMWVHTPTVQDKKNLKNWLGPRALMLNVPQWSGSNVCQQLRLALLTEIWANCETYRHFSDSSRPMQANINMGISQCRLILKYVASKDFKAGLINMFI